MATGKPTTSRDVNAELTFLTRALKAPTLREAVPRLAERAASRPGPTRSSWPPACNARWPPGSHTVVREGSAPPGSLPASLEEFDFDHARGLKRGHEQDQNRTTGDSQCLRPRRL